MIFNAKNFLITVIVSVLLSAIIIKVSIDDTPLPNIHGSKFNHKPIVTPTNPVTNVTLDHHSIITHSIPNIPINRIDTIHISKMFISRVILQSKNMDSLSDEIAEKYKEGYDISNIISQSIAVNYGDRGSTAEKYGYIQKGEIIVIMEKLTEK